MLGPDPSKGLLKDSTRLAAFLQECLVLGSLRGFRHFETCIRGREELILCVYTKNYIPKNTTLMPIPIIETYYDSFSWEPPELSSPFDKNLSEQKDKIAFLVTGYAKYRCPYVWLRSHQEELIRDRQNKDYPLQLKRTMDWKTTNVALWEIVAEILTMTSNPKNPFEINFNYIENLPLEEAVLLVGSLISFLKNIWIEADPTISFAELVYHDLQKLQIMHIDKAHEYSLKTKDDLFI